MPTIRVMSIVGAVAFVISACASMDMGKTTYQYPVPAQGFQPKKELAMRQEQAWNHVGRVLEAEGLSVASSDKSDGRLITENRDGIRHTTISILPAFGYQTRYRFSIHLAGAETNRTELHISCTLESSEAGKAWTNYGTTHPEEVKSLENWLYEKIESQGANAEITAEKVQKTDAATTVANGGGIKVRIKQGKNCNVRSVPWTRKNSPIATLKGGTEVEKIEETASWYRVRFVSGSTTREGWVLRTLLDE